MNNSHLITLLSGVPCCGKSTFRDVNFPDSFIVNRDDVRTQMLAEIGNVLTYGDLFKKPSENLEVGETHPTYGVVTQNRTWSVVEAANERLVVMFNEVIAEANKVLENGGHVIVDILNDTVKSRNISKSWFPDFFNFEVYLFEVKENRELILELNEIRGKNEDKFIPNEVIESFISNFEEPTIEENFIRVVNIDGLKGYRDNLKTGKVLISEMLPENSGDTELYEVSFEGTAEDFGFSNETDYLTADKAYEIAKEVADETNSSIEWDGYKPSWAV